MRPEPITEDMIVENRKAAEAQPSTGLPRLARILMEFGWQIDRDRQAERIPYFEEAAAIHRGLVTDGASEHITAAMHAIASLGLQYSLAHADDLSLAAKHEAAELARRVNLHREGKRQEIAILADLAHCLAEFGRFAQAVAVQQEVVAICRARESAGGYSSGHPAWQLLDLAIYLDLAGRADASLDIEREVLELERRRAANNPRQLPELAIWTSGAALRFADAGQPQRARALLAEAILACDQLPAEGKRGNFGFLQALQAAHFARSGARDERPDAVHAVPIGIDPDLALQPVLGSSLYHWSFSVRDAYRAGLEVINEAINARTHPIPHDAAQLAELGILLRRRNIRESVLDYGPGYFFEKIIPALAHSVDVERRLLVADPGIGPQRLVRALTDQALGCLAASSNANAGSALREAHALCSAATDSDAEAAADPIATDDPTATSGPGHAGPH
ncbi:tetratricopeptide repeat protein [Nocardia sp. NPDC048505]|uniref:tetratricopeptide repeat protein n=1 Tax=unclassified Nocardia TaxID=2637762 RepID=UPI0033C448C0